MIIITIILIIIIVTFCYYCFGVLFFFLIRGPIRSEENLLGNFLTLWCCELKELVSTQTYLYNPSVQPSLECLVINYQLLDNGGSKALIWLSERGMVVFSRIAQTCDVWAGYGSEGEFSCLFNPFYPCDDKTCTWKCGHNHHWYVRKEPHHGGANMWNHMKTCITYMYHYVFCLFIFSFACLIIFLHFYIFNIWFVLANKRLFFFFKKSL